MVEMSKLTYAVSHKPIKYFQDATIRRVDDMKRKTTRIETMFLPNRCSVTELPKKVRQDET